jgi:tetratricopeptide (TPR) repeat protein
MRVSTVLVALALGVAAPLALHAQDADPIAQLEAARDADPQNVSALRALGIAYYKRERFGDASAVLEHARVLAPKERLIALYAGMSAERIPNYTVARAAYDQYLGIPRSRFALRARRTDVQVRNRLIVLAREESIERAKAAIAAEAELSATPGDLKTIAVPAMKYSGPNPVELSPLERGLAELVITDLAKSKQLVVVERDRMQALADEIRLGESERVDSTTAVRAGQLLQAGRLVNGGIVEAGASLTLTSSVVTVATAQFSAPAQVTDGFDRFFDMQKDLVFRIFDQLQVTLTDEERAAIGVKQTNDLGAFLLYSRGLLAADAGRYEEAFRLFNQASAVDPSFTSAAARASLAQAATLGSQVTSTMLEASLPAAERGIVTSSAAGIVAPVVPVAPPLILFAGVPAIPSALRLPPVPPSPLGSTLATTAQSVNPPMVSALTSLARRSVQPPTPMLTPADAVLGFDRVILMNVFVPMPVFVP